MIRPTLLRLALAGALTATLAVAAGGCALLKSPPPVQTYRFGEAGGAAAGPASTAEPVQVLLRRIEFPQASEGDKILGVNGAETAYIKGARWISDARDLYTASLEGAFAAQSSRVRLIGPRELTPATKALALDVRAFEARYAEAGGAPEVVITIRARVLTMPDRRVSAEQTFSVTQPATANRVGAIVEAFDIATRDINAQMVAWMDRNAE